MSKRKTYQAVVVVEDSYEGTVQARNPDEAKKLAEALFDEGGYLQQFEQEIVRIFVTEVQP